MVSSGELCHHTNYSVDKNVIWKTDKLGNRNDTHIESPDILIIGDSFVAGIAVTQDSTLTNQLQSLLADRATVYNIAPATFSKIDSYLRLNRIKKPKTIIYEFGERGIPKPFKFANIPPRSFRSKAKSIIQNSHFFTHVTIIMDKILRQYSLEWIRARILKKTGEGIPGVEGSKMFFYQGKDYKFLHNHLEEITHNILTYKEYCDSINCNFLLLPMPSKETVYYDYVPFEKQSDYLFKLDSLLEQNGVKSINALQIYNKHRENNTSLLYHLDDTHWNSTGVNLVAKEIANTLYEDLDNTITASTIQQSE